MKKIFRFIFIASVLSFIFIGCEDPIEVPFESDAPRLVVDAWIQRFPEQTNGNVGIRCRLTSPFLEDSQPEEVDAVTLTNEYTGETLQFVQSESRSGLYLAKNNDANSDDEFRIDNSFFDGENVTFLLTVVYNNATYEARTTFATSTPVSISQGTAQIADEEPIEVTISFTDIPNQENNYILVTSNNNFFAIDDRFYENNTITVTYEPEIEENGERNFEAVRNAGATRAFHDYIAAILEQSDRLDDGFIQTPASTIRGNFYKVSNEQNIDNPDDFVLGYFAITEVYDARIELE